MRQLRPHVAEEAFLLAARFQSKEGYRLAAVEHQTRFVAVAGFRILHNLAWGRFCYVDDLVTDEALRSKGFGAELLAWLIDFAQQQKCARLELDSGIQRAAAHNFYRNHGLTITCHHFSTIL